jgi:hypothetical protein
MNWKLFVIVWVVCFLAIVGFLAACVWMPKAVLLAGCVVAALAVSLMAACAITDGLEPR